MNARKLFSIPHLFSLLQKTTFFFNYSGGKVLVKAEVKEIILSKGQKGVIVQKGEDRYRIGKEALNYGRFD